MDRWSGAAPGCGPLQVLAEDHVMNTRCGPGIHIGFRGGEHELGQGDGAGHEHVREFRWTRCGSVLCVKYNTSLLHPLHSKSFVSTLSSLIPVSDLSGGCYPRRRGAVPAGGADRPSCDAGVFRPVVTESTRRQPSTPSHSSPRRCPGVSSWPEVALVVAAGPSSLRRRPDHRRHENQGKAARNWPPSVRGPVLSVYGKDAG